PETEAVRAEVVGEALRRDTDARLAVALHDLHGDLPTHGRYLTLEASDTRLLRVVADDAHQRGVGEDDVVWLQAVGLALLRDEVLLRDVELLELGVAGDPDDLHAVLERPGDALEVVRGGDEHDLREVVVDVEV